MSDNTPPPFTPEQEAFIRKVVEEAVQAVKPMAGLFASGRGGTLSPAGAMVGGQGRELVRLPIGAPGSFPEQ